MAYPPFSISAGSQSSFRGIRVVANRVQRNIQRQPLISKAVPTAIGFAFGDCLTQYMNRPQEQPFQYDYIRGASMAGLGATVAGPIGLAFVRYLDGRVALGSPLLTNSATFVLDQALGCLLWQAAFLVVSGKQRQAVADYLNSVQNEALHQISTAVPGLVSAPFTAVSISSC